MFFNNKINIFFVLTMMASLFTACEQDAKDVNLPYVEPKIVVQSFISPISAEIAIYVSKSSPIFGAVNSPDPTLTDATVVMSDGTTTATAIFNSLKGYYIIDTAILKIVTGKTYNLKVTAADGRKVTSVCTVPFAPDTSGLEFTYDTLYTKTGNESRYDAEATLSWNDPVGQNNYYHSEVELGLEYTFSPGTIKWEKMYGSSYLDYFADKGKDGKKIVNGILVYSLSESNSGGVGSTKNYEFGGIRYFLYSTDINYHKYHETVSRSTNDPFSEPVIIYTNIEGGLGCFGAFNGFNKQIDF